MDNFTTNTYEMKRDIVNFSKKICKNSSKPESKFITDMIYGISKSKDILLSSIAEELDETTKKPYVINRLSDNLAKELSSSIDDNYLNIAMSSLGNSPVFLVDDSDVIKPLGNKFGSLGIVRDGSSRNKSYEKGYHHTEIVGLTEKRKVYYKKKWINLVLVYGLYDTPMMLASNILIKSKEDVIRIARNYLNRWRIEEYFKFKKQEYNFENFRVRTLQSINNLNKILTYTIGLIAILSEKIGKREFVNKIIKESKSLKDKVFLWFYQIARGIYNILSKAKTGIKDWEKIRKIKQYDGQLSLI